MFAYVVAPQTDAGVVRAEPGYYLGKTLLKKFIAKQTVLYIT